MDLFLPWLLCLVQYCPPWTSVACVTLRLDVRVANKKLSISLGSIPWNVLVCKFPTEEVVLPEPIARPCTISAKSQVSSQYHFERKTGVRKVYRGMNLVKVLRRVDHLCSVMVRDTHTWISSSWIHCCKLFFGGRITVRILTNLTEDHSMSPYNLGNYILMNLSAAFLNLKSDSSKCFGEVQGFTVHARQSLNRDSCLSFAAASRSRWVLSSSYMYLTQALFSSASVRVRETIGSAL